LVTSTRWLILHSERTNEMNLRRIWLFIRIVYRISDRHPDGSIVRMTPGLAWKVAGIMWPNKETNL